MIIRPPVTDEYEQIVKCIIETRGENYYSSKFYDADYLQNGEHELFVAFNESGNMTGFTGLSCAPFEKEKTLLSLLNVYPEFTGRGIGTKLLSYTVELLKSRGNKSVKGQVITRYSSIQSVLEGLGLRPAGVLKGIRDGKNASPFIQGKCALAIYVRGFSLINVGPLFVHTDVLEIASGVYADLEMPVSIISEGQSGSQNIINHFYDAHDDVLFIQVEECANGIEESIGNLVTKYRCSDNLTELVFLNLLSDSAVYGYEALSGAGYNFCGFDPLGSFEQAVFCKGDFYSANIEMTERLARLCNGFS